VPTDGILRLGGVIILFLTVSTSNLGGRILARAGGWRRKVGESASDNTRTRAGGTGGPALKGGLRAGGGGAALVTEDGPALEGLGGGGGGRPGVVGTFLSDPVATGCRILREGIGGAFFIVSGVVTRSGETFRWGTAGEGREGTAGEGREGTAGEGRNGMAGEGCETVIGGLEFRRGGGARRGEEGALIGGLGTVREGMPGADLAGGIGAGDEGLGGGILLAGGAVVAEISASRFGIDGGFPMLGGFANEMTLLEP
jgi:hypothetical protein